MCLILNYNITFDTFYGMNGKYLNITVMIKGHKGKIFNFLDILLTLFQLIPLLTLAYNQINVNYFCFQYQKNVY